MGALFSAPAAYANFAPIARVSVTPDEAFVGALIQFDGSASIDPDIGPQPLTFSWEFGDGATSNEVKPVHRYAVPGRFSVRLVVRDGIASGQSGLAVSILAVPTPTPTSHSAPLALSHDGTRLFVVNPDSNSFSIVDTAQNRVILETATCSQPSTIALSRDRLHAYVACQASNELWAFETRSGSVVRRVRVGHRPFGVAVVPSDGRVLVTNQGDDTVIVLAREDLRTLHTLPVADSPRAIAVTADGRRAIVTHFLTRGRAGTVSVVDLERLEVETTIPLAADPSPDTPSSGGGYPNLLSAIAIDPAGRFAWAGGLKSNTDRGTHLNRRPLAPSNILRGFMGRIELSTLSENPRRRIDTNNADSVSSIAFSPAGRYAYVTHQGAGRISIYDLLRAEQNDPRDGSSPQLEARIDVGDAPNGIVISPDGRRAYLLNSLSRSVSVVDVSNPKRPVQVDSVVVTREALAPQVALGKKLFHRSRAPVHSKDNYAACASCHPEGGADGRTWDLTQAGEGLRNTIDLRGRGGTDHGPVHWSANFDEIQDFENPIVHVFGGAGLAGDGRPPNSPLGPPNAGRSADLDALAAFVSSLKEGHPSPHRMRDGSLSESAKRGKAIFEDPTVACASCHAAPRFTDSVLTPDPDRYVMHDVGTLRPSSGKRLDGPLTALDTPSLIGLWDSAPYLHDGTAATLMDVLTTRNASDRHGRTSHLTPAEREELVSYLLSIDGRSDAPPRAEPRLSGCGCGVRGQEGQFGFLGLLAFAVGTAAFNSRTLRRRS